MPMKHQLFPVQKPPTKTQWGHVGMLEELPEEKKLVCRGREVYHPTLLGRKPDPNEVWRWSGSAHVQAIVSFALSHSGGSFRAGLPGVGSQTLGKLCMTYTPITFIPMLRCLHFQQAFSILKHKRYVTLNLFSGWLLFAGQLLHFNTAFLAPPA